MDKPIRIDKETIRRRMAERFIEKRLGDLLEELERHDPAIKVAKKFIHSIHAEKTPVLIDKEASFREDPHFDGQKIRLGYMSHLALDILKGNTDKEKARLLTLTLLHEATHSVGYGEFVAWYINLLFAKKLLGNEGVMKIINNYNLGTHPMKGVYRKYKRALIFDINKRSLEELRAVRWLMKRGLPPTKDLVERWLEGRRDIQRALTKYRFGVAGPEDLIKIGIINKTALHYLLNLLERNPQRYEELLLRNTPELPAYVLRLLGGERTE